MLCRILRDRMYHYYWEPTEENMEEIAGHYEWKAKTMPSIMIRFIFFGIGIRGICEPRKKILWIDDDDHRVFWHELGHALIYDLRKRFDILTLIPRFRIINEVNATFLGVLLSRSWYHVKSNAE